MVAYCVNWFTRKPLGFEDWKKYWLTNHEKRDSIIETLSEFDVISHPEMDSFVLYGKRVSACNPDGEYWFDEDDENILYVEKNSKLDKMIRQGLLELSKRLPKPKLP
ncbi:MAG TPA: hypothetical protein ENI22_00080 [Candidatus Pacearchaeota archaeon]|nr:hypothetical protein [Candidatus Pacearchaeota archaeon]